MSLTSTAQLTTAQLNQVNTLIANAAKPKDKIISDLTAQVQALKDSFNKGQVVDSNDFKIVNGLLKLRPKPADSITLSLPGIIKLVNFWNDSIPKLDKRLSGAFNTYQRSYTAFVKEVDARFLNLPASTPPYNDAPMAARIEALEQKKIPIKATSTSTTTTTTILE